ALAIAIDKGFTIHALSFTYGQRHTVELESAKRVAAHFKVTHHTILDLPLASLGGSALTGHGQVPKGETPSDQGIPVTYVPARNTIFLSYALALCEVTGATDIFIGVSHVDYSGYPDCRPQFIEAFELLANKATKIGVEGGHITVHAPLMELDKGETVKLGVSLGVDYSMTHTCYDPDNQGISCGRCDSCLLRLKGFAQAGLTDPISYQER
ncbi:7-cyano-7-deazaguanine synthase QueC, partial [Myxococcota bacterium]|nr:7-cyano-7-deazaguanine synthase QueC [Myxococcota bacterium]MBU1535600.1 7-cyano-7-deazaguanine synthase QueC [Myxococcota bacterium]